MLWAFCQLNLHTLVLFLFPKKFFITPTKMNHAAFWTFTVGIKAWSRTSVPICGPSNTPALIFSYDKPVKLRRRYWKHSLSRDNALTNCFIKPNLMWKGGKIILSLLTIGLWMTFGTPALSVSLVGRSLSPVRFTISAIPNATEAREFRLASLLTQQKTNHFQVKHKIQLCFDIWADPLLF